MLISQIIDLLERQMDNHGDVEANVEIIPGVKEEDLVTLVATCPVHGKEVHLVVPPWLTDSEGTNEVVISELYDTQGNPLELELVEEDDVEFSAEDMALLEDALRT